MTSWFADFRRRLLGRPPSALDEVRQWTLNRKADVFIALLESAFETQTPDRLAIEWMLKELTLKFHEADRAYCVRDPHTFTMSWVGDLDPAQYAKMSRYVEEIFAAKAARGKR